jgi:hypothetical protein
VKSGWALAGLCLLFLAAFFFQRGRSVVLRIEADRPLAERVALQSGLSVAEVMSLRELLGLDRSEEQLTADAQRFATTRVEQGDNLAILTIAGHEDLATELWEQSGRDPSRARTLLTELPESILTVRFADMTIRFARR